MLKDVSLDKILFLDIETVSAEKEYSQLNETMQGLWDLKFNQRFGQEEKSSSELYRKAGIFAEFGKIICISCGFFTSRKAEEFRIKSFYGHDEKEVLYDFAQLLDDQFNGKEHRLCAHNGKEFDFPFLARRMLIQGIMLPSILDTPGKKPWEVNHIDTMELWKFGDYKNYTSLKLLTAIFEIPTPKDDIDGSMIYDVYYEEENLDRIVTYCQKDVMAIARLYQKYSGMDYIRDDHIKIIS